MRAGIVPSVVVLLGGCGRLGFDAVSADAAADAARGTYPESVLADLPLAYYRLGEPAGTIARDSAGTADATLQTSTGGVITYARPGALPGDPDTAIGFEADGNTGPRGDAWGQFPAVSPVWAGDFTIEVFARALSDAPNFYRRPIVICENYTNNGFRTGWVTGMTPGFYTSQAGRSTDFDATRPLVIGTWTHVAYVRRGTTMEIFLDAQPAGSASIDYLPPDPTSECGFGSFHGEPGHGELDELAIYDRALSQQTLAAHLAAAQL